MIFRVVSSFPYYFSGISSFFFKKNIYLKPHVLVDFRDGSWSKSVVGSFFTVVKIAFCFEEKRKQKMRKGVSRGWYPVLSFIFFNSGLKEIVSSFMVRDLERQEKINRSGINKHHIIFLTQISLNFTNNSELVKLNGSH